MDCSLAYADQPAENKYLNYMRTAKYTFILRGEAIAIVKTTKYLGVMVTDALSWKSQYAFTMKRARSAMGTIAEIVANPYFDIDLKLAIWRTKVMSSLLYSSDI